MFNLTAVGDILELTVTVTGHSAYCQHWPPSASVCTCEVICCSTHTL